MNEQLLQDHERRLVDHGRRLRRLEDERIRDDERDKQTKDTLERIQKSSDSNGVKLAALERTITRWAGGLAAILVGFGIAMSLIQMLH